MRPKARIDKYFDLFIKQIERTGLKTEEKNLILDNQKQILKYWKDNPDQRLTQMLYNTTGIMHYHGWLYQKEDDSYLQQLGIDARELVLWGTINPLYNDHFLTKYNNVNIWSMAFFLCDGGYNSDSVFQIELKDNEYNNSLLDFINKNMFSDTVIKKRERKNNEVYDIKRGKTIYSTYNKKNTEVIKKYFIDKKDKRTFFSFHKEQLFYFLRGLFDADGTISYSERQKKNGYISKDFNVIYSTNRNIGFQLSELLNLFNISHKYYIDKRSDNAVVIKVGKNIQDKIAFLKKIYNESKIDIETEKEIQFKTLYNEKLNQIDKNKELLYKAPDLSYKYLWIDDITTEHIQAILKTQKNIHPMYKAEFEKELRKRGEEVPTKYGTIKGEMIQLYEAMEMADFKGFVNSYLPNLTDLEGFYDDFEDAGIDLYVEWTDEKKVDGLYFEITEAMSKDSVIRLMELVMMHKPDIFERKSKNVYFINWL